jgi:hypothetical protein
MFDEAVIIHLDPSSNPPRTRSRRITNVAFWNKTSIEATRE